MIGISFHCAAGSPCVCDRTALAGNCFSVADVTLISFCKNMCQTDTRPISAPRPNLVRNAMHHYVRQAIAAKP